MKKICLIVVVMSFLFVGCNNEKIEKTNYDIKDSGVENSICDSTTQDSTTENTVQENTAQDNTIQENTVQENTAQDNTIQENTVQENTAQDNTIQENTVQENITQNNTMKETEDKSADIATKKDEQEENKEESEMNMENVKLAVNVQNKILTASFENNSSAKALKELLKVQDITISMQDYGDFEKVGSLGQTLPENNEQITTVPGDIILYQGDKITIYYDTNSWNFTKIAHIDGADKENLKKILGEGDVTVTLSLK